MQTIPDRVLDAIIAAKPHTALVVDKLRTDPENIMSPTWEKHIAQQAMIGFFPAGLGGYDMLHLAACYYGHPWGGTWLRLAEAAEESGYDDSHLRRLIGAGKLGAIKRGKTWYVRRDALPSKEA